MKERIGGIVFFGSLFWLAFVFLFYAGLFVNYIEHHGIPIFFNQFFVDSQFWWIWPAGILLFGFVFMMEGRTALKVAVFSLSFLAALSTWVPSVGSAVGYGLFSKEGVDYRFNRVVVKGATLLYSGRGYDYVKVPGKEPTLRYPTANRVR
ncbi:hypothetical protein [Hydrogenimonas sp.]